MTRQPVVCENAALAGIFGQSPATNNNPDLALAVGDPGTTGANENANTGGYARQVLTMGSPSSGSILNTNVLNYSTAGTVPVGYAFGCTSTTYGGGVAGSGMVLLAAVTSTAITIPAGGITMGAS